MRRASYVRLFADERGESHFAEVEVELGPVDYSPPAPLLYVAGLFPATGCAFVCAPGDWAGQIPHPSPRRSVFCTLRGEYEVTASDGEVRCFPVGSLLLLEDTTGKGHASRIVGGDVLVLAVALAD